MYYTTKELADLFKYGSPRTLLVALHNNRKGITKSAFLKEVWDCRERVGKRWLFNKTMIDQILSLLNSTKK